MRANDITRRRLMAERNGCSFPLFFPCSSVWMAMRDRWPSVAWVVSSGVTSILCNSIKEKLSMHRERARQRRRGIFSYSSSSESITARARNTSPALNCHWVICLVRMIIYYPFHQIDFDTTNESTNLDLLMK